MFHQALTVENLYQASIKDIKPRLVELQAENSQVQKIRVKEIGKRWQDFDKILYYQNLPYIFEIIKIELINKYHDNHLQATLVSKKT